MSDFTIYPSTLCPVSTLPWFQPHIPVFSVDYIELNEKNAAAVAAAGGQQAAGVPQSHLLHSLYSRNPAMFGSGQQAAAMAAWAASANSHFQYSSPYNHREAQQQQQGYNDGQQQQQQPQQQQQQPQNNGSNNGYAPQQGCNSALS